jgi:hypothetical protein
LRSEEDQVVPCALVSARAGSASSQFLATGRQSRQVATTTGRIDAMSPTATTPPEATNQPVAATRESLSQLAARVLDQLSPSAWLPAGALVAIALLYGSLRAHYNKVLDSMMAIGNITFQSLFLLVGAIVILTMAIQAFEFEAIRLLEGYWGSGLLTRPLTQAGCSYHRWRRRRLQESMERLEDQAFALARQRMLHEGISRSLVDAIEASRLPVALSAQRRSPWPWRRANLDERAQDFDWREHAPPDLIRRADDIATRVSRYYPSRDYRVLPTMLGNALRTYEDRLHELVGGSMEGMVLRLYDSWPASLKDEHDHYRSRLNLYCSLVLVSLLSTALAWPILFVGDWLAPSFATALTVSFAYFSYRAAIASARGYQTVLATALDSLERSGEATQ